MKSLASIVLNIELGVLKDARAAYPHLGDTFSRDESRLSRLVKDRGMGLFTLDLPHLDSLLIRGLETGSLVLDGPLCHRVSKRIQVPRLFRGLWLLVFDRSGCLKDDVDPSAISFIRQLCAGFKKLEGACSPKRIESAIGDYVNVEHQMRPPSLNWEDDRLGFWDHGLHLSFEDAVPAPLPLFPDYNSADPGMKHVLDKVQKTFDLILPALGDFEPISASADMESNHTGTGFKHGPGAVADRKGIVNKYDFPRWSSKLEYCFPYRLCATIASDEESIPLNHEVASRLLAVPKTAKAPRLIAAEPTEHMFCQQLTKRLLEERLSKLFGETFICFAKQSLSQRMVVQASIDRSLATVDLRSASDKLSLWCVERMCRSNPSLLALLHSHRTRTISYDNGRIFIKMKKFASQGTAVTFPIQTLFFLGVALACSMRGKPTWSKIRKLRSKVRVFGDDIILPSTSYAMLVRTLTILGLEVNMDKSFHKGFFRESCGVDAYKGYDVTPCKPQRVLDVGPQSRRAILDVSNNLFEKGFWNASMALESTLGEFLLRRLPIVGRDCGITGRLSFCGEEFSHLRSRWNSQLHRREFRIHAIRNREDRIVFGERFSLLQYFTEAPSGRLLWRPGVTKRTKVSDGLVWDPLYAVLPKRTG